MNHVHPPPHEHPAPQRDVTRIEWLIGALMAGPAGWILQLVAGYAVASHACRPGDAPRSVAPSGGWSGEHIGLLILNLASLTLTLAGGAVALGEWRRARRMEPGEGAALDVGEGRTRFLAACGILVAGAFGLAILFDTAWPFFIPPCWRFT